jgi:GAF domain-containing protein
VDELQQAIDELLAQTRASRITLRLGVDGDFFPVAYESLAPGAPSIREVVAPDMPNQPVVRLASRGQQVVQNDTRSLFTDDENFQTMLGMYGGLRAQIVTPVMDGDRLLGLISVHELRETREWTAEEQDAARTCADRVRAVVATA